MNCFICNASSWNEPIETIEIGQFKIGGCVRCGTAIKKSQKLRQSILRNLEAGYEKRKKEERRHQASAG